MGAGGAHRGLEVVLDEETRRYLRLYQHVSLDHSAEHRLTHLLAETVEATHRRLHFQGVYHHCEPHALDEIPVRRLSELAACHDTSGPTFTL